MIHKQAYRKTGALLLFLCLGCQFANVRADGLPGEFLLDQRWRDIISDRSPLSNPAFLTRENYITGRIVFTPSVQGAFNFGEVGLTVPIGLTQSVGLSYVGESSEIDSLINTTSTQTGFQDNLFMGTYAWNFWKGMSIGANVNVLAQNAYGETRLGYGLDLGASYRLPRNAVIGNHMLGINAQNLLAPQLPATSAANNAETYSRNLRLTLNSNYWEKQVESNFDFCIKDFLASADEFKDSALRLVSPKLEWEFSGRLGVSILKTLRLYGLFGINNVGFEFWGIAIGGNFPVVNQGRDLKFAYQLNKAEPEGIWSNTMYLIGQAGRSREEAYARRMARRSDVTPNLIYLNALKLYSAGKYWEAFFLFSQILNEYPDFFKNDWVTYYSGNCQEQLDMREIAVMSYNSLKLEYAQSIANYHAELGLMRICYRNEDYGCAMRQFDLLNGPAVPDSIKFAADFVMGQIDMANKDYSKAVALFNTVPPEHPDYLFAQHSAAVALLSVDKTADAVAYLTTCINGVPTTPAQKEIVNRSLLFLSYLLYENLIQEDRPLSKAITLLRKIPPGSIYHDEALLLLGWTAVKAHQGADCIAAGQPLQSTKNPLFHFEGSLIAAYGHTIQKDYAGAKGILEDASSSLAALKPPTQDSLGREKQSYISTRTSYDFLAKKMAECSQKQQSGAVVQENASLHDQQRDLKTKLDESMSYFDWYKKASFLTRNVAAIKEDITYLLAVVSKRTSETGSQKEYNKMIDKQKNIDKEIEKLKGKLENLKDNKK